MHHLVEVWLSEIGRMLRASLDRDLEVQEKTSHADLVTEMDKQVEAYLIQQIRQHFPQDRILGEEGQGDPIEDTRGRIWIIDPIDGTLNFVKQGNYFATMIGIYQDGQAQAGYIYDVMRDDLYYGIVGEGVYLNHQALQPCLDHQLEDALLLINQHHWTTDDPGLGALIEASLASRGYGSAAMEIIALLRGEASIYYAVRLQPWDFAAGLAIFTQLGLTVSDRSGNDLNLLQASSVVFTHPDLHPQVMQVLNQE